MNKQAILCGIANEVQKKHPWKISQEKYLSLFKELPKAFIEERQFYDNLLEKSKSFKTCQLILTQAKVEIKLNIDECIVFELSLDKWQEARSHNILPGDIKKLIKINI